MTLFFLSLWCLDVFLLGDTLKDFCNCPEYKKTGNSTNKEEVMNQPLEPNHCSTVPVLTLGAGPDNPIMLD